MFKLSDYLTQDEWVASYAIYLAHAVEFPEHFPMFGTLSSHLRGGIWLLNALGYRGWKGVKVVETGAEYITPIQEGNAATVLQEWLEKQLHLHARWGEAITWLEAQTFEDCPPEHLQAVLDLLRERMEHMDPHARVGWSGSFAGFSSEGGTPAD